MAEQLGKIVEHHTSKSTKPNYSRIWTTPYLFMTREITKSWISILFLHDFQERGTGRTTILRPGEQYPSEEPGVLRNSSVPVQPIQVRKSRTRSVYSEVNIYLKEVA